MTKKLDIQKILNTNPKIDPAQLQRNLDAIEALRKNGVIVGPNYRLASPYTRPPRSSDATLDKRVGTLHLRDNE